MSYIPSTKEQYLSDGSENAYWEGNLSNSDQNYIAGFDFAFDHMKEQFMDTDAMDLEHINVDTEAVANIAEGEECTDEDLRDFNPETLAVLGIRESLIEALDSWRNELIVSMIENSESEKDLP